MLPEARKPETLPPSRLNGGWGVRSDLEENGHTPWRRLQCDWNVGMWLCQAKRSRPRACRIPGNLQICPAAWATRPIFRRTHRCCDPIHEYLPCNQQIRNLSCGFPTNYLSAWKPEHSQLLWSCTSGYSLAGTPVTSRPFHKGRRKTYFSSLQVLCVWRNGQSTPRTKQCVVTRVSSVCWREPGVRPNCKVWHFPEETNRREGLFAGYVNTWLKLKQDSAGWPAGVETEEQKAEYVRRYEEHEGIKLDPEKIFSH